MTATFPPYWAGTGNVAYHHALGLHARGHAVEVFTALPLKREPLTLPFPVHYLPTVFRVGNAPLTPGLLHALNGFDVIHLHYPYIFGAELCVASIRESLTPLVVTYHNDLLSSGWKGPLFKAYSRICQPWGLEHAARIAATSLDYAQHSMLSRSLRDMSRVSEIPNGVDPIVFSPSPAHLASADCAGQGRANPEAARGAQPTVLFVGAMDSAHFFKGVPILIDALSRIAGVRGMFVGDGDRRSEFERLAADKLGSRAVFAGAVDQAALVEAYRRASVTVLPSITQGEAFGVVLLESLACGTPVVASNLPGVRTVVEDGVDGYLASPGDAAALADAIAVCVDSEVSQRMGAAGRQKVLRRYTWDRVTDDLESLYRAVLAEGATSDTSDL